MQVTKFGCGGYSIGIGTSHSLFDGTAAFDFISAWASQTNYYVKENNNNNNNKPLLLVHERGRLLVASNTNTNMNDQTKFEGISSTIDYSNNQTIIRSVAAIDHLYQLIKQAGIIIDNTNDYDKDYSVLRTFHISGEMIDKLKKKVYYGEESFWCSTFEILAAHLWKVSSHSNILDFICFFL